MQDQPKPSVTLIAASILVIAGSLFLVSVAIATLLTFDPCAIATGIIIIPLPALLAILQYCGTFRRRRGAAMASSLILFINAGFFAFGLVTNFGDSEVLNGSLRADELQLFLALLLVVVVCGGTGLMNWQWTHSLPKTPGPREKWQFSIKEMLIATAVIACMTAVVTWVMRLSIPEVEECVDHDHVPFRTPEGATDIFDLVTTSSLTIADSAGRSERVRVELNQFLWGQDKRQTTRYI